MPPAPPTQGPRKPGSPPDGPQGGADATPAPSGPAPAPAPGDESVTDARPLALLPGASTEGEGEELDFDREQPRSEVIELDDAAVEVAPTARAARVGPPSWLPDAAAEPDELRGADAGDAEAAVDAAPADGDAPGSDDDGASDDIGVLDGDGAPVHIGASDDDGAPDDDGVEELDADAVVAEPSVVGADPQHPAAAPAPPPPPNEGAPLPRRPTTAFTAPPPPPSIVAEVPPPSTQPLDDAIAEAQANNWSARAARLRAELDAEADRARASFLAYEIGELTERRLRDEAGAVKLYGRALQSDPSLRANLWAIRRVFYRRGLWPNLIKLLDAEQRFAQSDGERADLLVEKGQVLEDRSHDRSAAKDAYDRAIALAPDDAPALLARERLALEEKDSATLERVWRALADASADPKRRVTYLLDLVELCESRGDDGVQTALELLAEAMALGADRRRVVRLRERFAERADEPETLLAALEARALLLAEAFGPGGVTPASADLAEPESVASDRGARLRGEIVACRRRAAHIAARAGDPDRAWAYLQQAQALVPGEPLLLFDLASLAEETGRHEALAELCLGLGALTGDPRRSLALRLRRADALFRAGSAAMAEAELDRVVAEAPGYWPVIAWRQRRTIDEVAAAARDGRDGSPDPRAPAAGAGEAAWARLGALYLAEAAAARLGNAFGPGVELGPDPEWAAAAYVAAGDVFAQRLRRASEAETAYAQALEVVPGHASAVWAMVGLLEASGRPSAACELLEERVETLAARVGAEPTLAGALEDALEWLARLREEEGRFADSVMALRRLADLHPGDTTRRLRLLELMADAGQHHERVELLRRMAEAELDPLRRAELCAEVARTCEDDLGREADAAQAWLEVLGARPDDRLARARLVALWRRAGRWDDLVALRRAEAESTADPRAAARALGEAAAILERRLGRPAEAAALYQELAERHPDDPASLHLAAAAVAGQPEHEVVALTRLAQQQGPDSGLGLTLFAVGEAHERAGRAGEAAAAFAAAREAGGVGAHADWALWRLSARDDSGVEASVALAGLAEGRSGPIGAELLEEVAWQNAHELESAAAHFDAALAQDPGRPGPRLGKALVAARRKDAAALAEALVAQADNVTDPNVAAGLLLRAATLTDGAGSAGEGAATGARLAMAAATRLGPTAPGAAGATLEAAERAAPADADVDARDALLARRIQLAGGPSLAAVLDRERAAALAAAGRLEAAGRVLAERLAQAPDDLATLAALRQLARRAGDRETLARASARLGLGLFDPESAASCLAEAAESYEALGRSADALKVWRLVLERTPLDDRAYQRARELAADDRETRLVLCSLRLRHVGEPSEEVPYRLERAALRSELGDQSGAARDLQKILDVEPGHAEALERLASLELGRGDGAAAEALFERYLEVAPAGPGARRARLELAKRCQAQGEDAQAAALYQAVIADDGADSDAAHAVREALVALLERGGDFARAADELEKLGAARGDRGLRAKDELRAARIYRHKLKDAGRARRALELARTLDPLAIEVTRELAGLQSGDERAATIASAFTDVRAALAKDPTAGELYGLCEKLAVLAGDEDLARLAGGAVVALGTADPGEKVDHERRALAVLARPALPKRALPTERVRAALAHPGAQGAWAVVWSCIHDAVAALGSHEPAQLGFTKADRIAAKNLAKQAPLVDAWLKALGMADVEVFVSASQNGAAHAPAVENPTLFLSADVARGDGLEARARLGRALGLLWARTEPVWALPPDELELVLAAACKLGGADLSRLPALAAAQARRGFDDRVKVLGKALTRRGKKHLPQALVELERRGDDLASFRLGARASAARLGLLVAGDVPAALAAATRATTGAASDDPLVVDLLVYAVAEDHLGLRRELGL